MVLENVLRELGIPIDPKEFSRHISEKGERIEVNWETLEELSNNGSYQDYCHIIDVLTHLKILSTDWTKGTYCVSGCGVPLNPSATGFARFFTRREDAEAFAETKKSRYYGVEIFEGR